MKEITKVKLGINKDAIVVVSSNVEMHDKNDKDEAYIIMFNIMLLFRFRRAHVFEYLFRFCICLG